MLQTIKSVAGLALVVNALRVPGATIGQILTHNGTEFVAADPTGGSPTGAAGGDLASTYPNPTLKSTIATAVTWNGAQVFGNALTQSGGAWSLTGNGASLAKTTSGALTIDGAGGVTVKSNGATIAALTAGGDLNITTADQKQFSVATTDDLTLGGTTYVTSLTMSQFTATLTGSSQLGAGPLVAASLALAASTATLSANTTTRFNVGGSERARIFSSGCIAIGNTVDSTFPSVLMAYQGYFAQLDSDGATARVVATLQSAHAQSFGDSSTGMTTTYTGKTVNLTSNGAALTITGGAASTWSTTAGKQTISGFAGLDLLVGSASTINLGTSLATALNVGQDTVSTTKYSGGTVVGDSATTKAVSFTVSAFISRYYLTADSLTITLDDALPVGATWELWHFTTTASPGHVLTPTSGTVAQYPSLAPAATLTWPANQPTMTVTKKAAGVFVVS